jgi:uncharacterized protein (DUF1015 family)
MAAIKPFRGIRPVKELAERVAALPYDVMSREEAEKMVEGNEFSFLRVDRAEVELPKSIPFDHPRVYERAAQNLKDLINRGVLVKDDRDLLYLYQLETGDICQTGLVACLSIDDYLNGTIKKHEHTREDKEQDRINHVLSCNAHTGPILLFSRYDDSIREITEIWIQNNDPLYGFTADDGIIHRVWMIDDDNVIGNIVRLFAGVDKLYIADGHHRCAAAVKAGLLKRSGGFCGDEEFNYFLGVIFPHNQLRILDYNRIVKDLNGFTEEEFLSRVGKNFLINPWEGGTPYKPDRVHCFGMFLKDRWFKLEAIAGSWDDNDPVKRLDVNILQQNLLQPVLGIKNPRNDKRIEFVGGIRGLEELEKRVREEGNGVAFSLYPTSIEELMAVADMGQVMPPKSTWFEPKLRSGLFIHDIE